ncbi:sulfurtransferase FdhD [Candidatus Poribacteria bacterium]|nr:sulfurtransferase FdhD [Candidatus Poribacteria bacterium]
MRQANQIKRKIWSIRSEGEFYKSETRLDSIAIEEPLEIRLKSGNEVRTVAITMRTPGHDYELTTGFLLSEGILRHRQDFSDMRYCLDQADTVTQEYNQLMITLRNGDLSKLPQLERHFFTNSACGVCGRTMIEDLQHRAEPLPNDVASTLAISSDTIRSLPVSLRSSQKIFDRTGGLHAAALFSANGEVLTVREDIGRHNALDKLLGWGLLNDQLPFNNHILLVSGRASFELLQKCAVAKIPIFCAISAPSSLAVSLAQQFGITLIGFLRNERYNIYTYPERITNTKS